MTKTQIQELKAILAVLSSRLQGDRLEDPMRVLAYRAQVLVDEAMRRDSAMRRDAHQAVRKAG